MPSSSPSQKPPAWYTADPLRGSGKNGTLIDEDFLSALYISKSEYQEMRNTCIRILDRQGGDTRLKIDLRSIWKRREGAEVKEMMLREFISVHPEVFGNTCRLQHVPANWDAIKWTLAELCMISANASRTRQLPRANAGSQVNSPNHLTASASTTSMAVTQELPRMPPNGPHVLLTHPMILDNLVIPVVYGDRRVDIMPYEFRRSDKADVPQFVSDISLDRLVSILTQKFKADAALQVWGMNSTRSFIELEDDHHLRIALISFVLFAWPGPENPPGLEVRPVQRSPSP